MRKNLFGILIIIILAVSSLLVLVILSNPIETNNNIPKLTEFTIDKAENSSIQYRDYTIYSRLGDNGNNYLRISATVECLEGSEEINYVAFMYREQFLTFKYWQVYWNGSFHIDYRYTEDWVDLQLDHCTTSTTNTTRTVTFAILINWEHPPAYASDTVDNIVSWSTLSWGEGNVLPVMRTYNYEVESRLSMQVSPTITETTVDTGSSCNYSGDIQYFGSPNGWTPLASEVDVQVRRTAPSVTDWNYTTNPALDGTFTVTPTTDGTHVGTNTFELRVVADGSTTNLLASTYSDSVVSELMFTNLLSPCPGIFLKSGAITLYTEINTIYQNNVSEWHPYEA